MSVYLGSGSIGIALPNEAKDGGKLRSQFIKLYYHLSRLAVGMLRRIPRFSNSSTRLARQVLLLQSNMRLTVETCSSTEFRSNRYYSTHDWNHYDNKNPWDVAPFIMRTRTGTAATIIISSFLALMAPVGIVAWQVSRD